MKAAGGRERSGGEGALVVSFEDREGRGKRKEEIERMRQCVCVSCVCVQGPTE